MKIIKGFIVVWLLLLSFTVYAHPGRTDSSGGHWDRSAGTYHYHSGEYAGRSSSGHSSNAVYDDFIKPYTPTPQPENKLTTSTPAAISRQKDNDVLTKIFNALPQVFNFLVQSICIMFALGFALALLYAALQRHLPKYKLQKYREAIDKYLFVQEAMAQKPEPAAGLIPPKFEIGTDGLPKEKTSADWGQTFTLYLTHYGGKYHIKKGCCGAVWKEHICKVNFSNKKNTFCKKCAPGYIPPSLVWYKSYKQALVREANYQNALKNIDEVKNTLIQAYKQCNSPWTKLLLFFSQKCKTILKELNHQTDALLKKEKTSLHP